MSDDWKIDMLKKMWSGEETDPNKQELIKKTKKTSKPNSVKWVEIDLHHYHELSKQLDITEQAIDKAILSNQNGIKIIHGKGQGVLRSELIKMLKNHPHILDFKSIKDHYNESGVIRIRFKN